MIDLDVVCPAGEPVAETSEGAACRCRIEHNTLTIRRDPTSLVSFCLGRYDTCSTWREDKHRIWEASTTPMERWMQKMRPTAGLVG